jgi:hypothetical protein
MKALLGFLTATIVAALTFGHFAGATAAGAFPSQAPREGTTLYCASDDMRRNICAADTRGGVQMVRQRSEATCIFNRTWGYDDHGIWVDRGCRADFQIGAATWGGWGQTYTIYCASDDMGRDFCPTDIHHGVRLARQRSEAECLYGRTWGYNHRGIWVDRGCRADFEIGNSGWNGGGESQSLYCPSDDMHLHYCQADTSRGVRLIRQRSEADCLYGRTWGYDDRGIWVDRGCRADFQVAGGDGDADDDDDDVAYGNVQNIYCASDDMHRHQCSADTRSGVRMLRQRSGSPCTYGRTWGYDNRSIWVDHGCRADFQIGGGDAGQSVGTTSLYCASDDMHRHQCSANTRSGVRMLRQRSGSPCEYGRTWGYDNSSIWVDHGCRADFEVGHPR